jgi:Glycosyltransferase
MERAYKGFDNLVIVPVSEWLYNRAKQSPFYKDKRFQVITNGIDTNNIFKPTDYTDIKCKLGIGNEKIILHVTPNFMSPIKGGKYVIEIANRLLKYNVKILIIGFNGNKENLPENIIPLPHTKNQKELAAFYTMADITLLTSKKETFSMICAESISCNTPIVGFKAGGPEVISFKEYSEFVENGDVDALECIIKKWINIKSHNDNTYYSKATTYYSKELMYEKYLDLYKGRFK